MFMRKLWLGLALVIALSGAAFAGEPGYTPANDSGCRVFNPSVEPGDSVTWSGSCSNGYASGRGTLQWFSNGADAGQYQGDMKEGKRHGTGTYKWTNGSSYSGGWADNKLHGKGVYIYADGTKDEASFVQGKYNGAGMRNKKNGVLISFVAVDDKFEHSIELIHDIKKGCYISNMERDNRKEFFGMDSPTDLYFDKRDAKYSWKGECLNGFAHGNGTLMVDAFISRGGPSEKKRFEYLVNANNGIVDGEVIILDGYDMSTSKTIYVYFDREYRNQTEYANSKLKLQEKVSLVHRVSLSAQVALNEAKQLEKSNLQKSMDIYGLIINYYPNTKESSAARYRKAFWDAHYSYDFEKFVNTYVKNDPDKLVPKAKIKLAAALKREAEGRRESEAARSTYSMSCQQRTDGYTGAYQSYDSTWESYTTTANCNSGGTAYAYYRKKDPRVIIYGSKGFSCAVSQDSIYDGDISEGLRRACKGK